MSVKSAFLNVANANLNNFEYAIICSKHKTYPAAAIAAIKCEGYGGAKHVIWEVKEYEVDRKNNGK